MIAATWNTGTSATPAMQNGITASGMMVADRHHVGPHLIDAAVDDPFRIKLHVRRLDRLGVERELQNVLGLDQSRRAGTREQVTAGILRMADADMAEGVENAFVRQHAVGERDLMADSARSSAREIPDFGLPDEG